MGVKSYACDTTTALQLSSAVFRWYVYSYANYYSQLSYYANYHMAYYGDTQWPWKWPCFPKWMTWAWWLIALYRLSTCEVAYTCIQDITSHMTSLLYTGIWKSLRLRKVMTFIRLQVKIITPGLALSSTWETGQKDTKFKAICHCTTRPRHSHADTFTKPKPMTERFWFSGWPYSDFPLTVHGQSWGL